MEVPRMRCELRNHEANELALLPIPQLDGGLNTMACLKHARETEFFCQVHDHPHLGFEDRTHACIRCIEDRVQTAGMEAGRGYWKELKSGLPEGMFAMIMAGASEIREHPAITILRWIMTSAERMKRAPGDIVQEIVRSQSLELILPSLTGENEKR